jgi:hypothetical protein
MILFEAAMKERAIRAMHEVIQIQSRTCVWSEIQKLTKKNNENSALAYKKA